MTCLEAQGLTTPFLDDKLDPAQLEDFLDHVNHCEDCKEELEVYYTLLKGMQLLDEDRNLSNNFHLEFENMLKRSEDRIIKHKVQLIQKSIILVIIMGVIAFVTNFGVEEMVQKDIVPSKDYQVDGSFKLENYYFDRKNTRLNDVFFQNYQVFYEHELQNNDQEINAEKGETDGK